jgi:ribosomal protein L40E
MKICPKCQAEHSLNGRFCSRKCGNSRVLSDEVKSKIRSSVNQTYALQGSKCKGKEGWKHTDADRALKSQRTLEHYDRAGRIERTLEELQAINKMRVGEYRARKYNATPADANKKLIKEIYKACPNGYEVDHIIALVAGGLHHESNLQYLPALENRRKNKTQNYNVELAIRWQDVVK